MVLQLRPSNNALLRAHIPGAREQFGYPATPLPFSLPPLSIAIFLPSIPLPSIGGGGQGCPRLRANFSPAQPRARRDVLFSQASTVSSCAFCEQRGHPGCFPYSSPSLCTISVSSRQGTHVAPIAAVERGPSEGARSGSTGATWVSCRSFFFPLLLRSIGGCGQGCPRLRASNEHRFIVRVLRARRAPGRSLPSLASPSPCPVQCPRNPLAL